MKFNSLRKIQSPVSTRTFSTVARSQIFANPVHVLALFIATLIGSSQWLAAQTALDDYIKKADDSYSFNLDNTFVRSGYLRHDIDLTSQTWRVPTEVTQSWKDPGDDTQNQWDHKMTILQPEGVPSTTAILLIGGGSGPGSFISGSEELALAGSALLSNSVIVDLPMVPNQRLQFAGETFTRTEDEIIAKTFKKFLANSPSDTNVDEWPLLLPMVKSAVSAMDATQAYMAGLDEPVLIDSFFIIGASKRGWTTWLTAAVEARPGGPNRVSGIAPAVIDFLNIDESMRHHRKAYADVTDAITGGFSDQVEDYYFEGVLDHIVPTEGGTISPRAQELLNIIDPYEYRDRLDLPKYILNGTGDEFFVSDSSQFYSSDLLGPTYLRYIPNAGHGLDDSALPGALIFKAALDQGLKLPKFVWDIAEDGTSITVNTSTDDSLVEVMMWSATNPDKRDFRMNTFGPQWSSESLLEVEANEYMASVSMPATGATAYMVELTYNLGGQELKFTTDISVVENPASVAVPEPASCALLVFGLIVSLLGGSRGKRRRKAKV